MALLVVIAPFMTTQSAQAASTLDIAAESAILVDAETGKILFSKNPDMKLPPASMTKMMTEYLVLEAIEAGKITWDTTTQISDYAYKISADISSSGTGLTQDVDYKVRDLYNAMAINSDNATTIALAELVAGSEGEFVKMMNKKGKEMGLPDFEFVNSTGLENADLGDNYPKGTEPDGINYMSARSSALLAYHLVNDHPEALEVSRVPQTEFDGHMIDNWNWMLPHDSVNFKQFYYEGVDGLKTGHTDLAGYCFTGTAERNGQRLISVVMKTDSIPARFKETAKLLDYGYNNFNSKELFPAGYQLKDKATIDVVKGKEDQVAIATNAPLTVPVQQGDEKNYTVTYHLDKDKLDKEGALVAPVKKGEKIGTAELVYKGEDAGYIFENKKHVVDVVATETVEKSNWFMLTLDAIGGFFADIFSSIVDMVKGWFN
ncbi:MULTISPECIES: D-alanyl-D-alanine carboxypeptidase family protein [unclassified Virgibacillus]|uniref:D-alanyl-D-alanine carboxypeptidase family protein n=1 Tax=Virgibacillus sp. LDC-1 TaxID=3039856 RepID=UPI0024DEFC85|nr:D-alanyl-D-alanine carboxypeptidase family protein [Virgibacillus sp. LDC-1]